MGFELDRIMKQYGVNTPGLVNYSGAAAPVAPTAYTGTDQTLADKYKTDLAAYNTTRADLMGKYDVDQKAYNDYKTNYQNRLQNAPMYAQSQFDTGYGTTPSTVATGSRANITANLPGGIGIDQQNRNVKNWFAENPNATAAQIKAAQAEYGVNDADIRNAMGSDFIYGRNKFIYDAPLPEGMSGTMGGTGFDPVTGRSDLGTAGGSGQYVTEPSGYGSMYMRTASLPGNVGIERATQAIRDWFAKNPNATDAQIKAAQAAHGVSNKDIYNATGSYYGNQLAAPTYGVTPILTPGTATAALPLPPPPPPLPPLAEPSTAVETIPGWDGATGFRHGGPVKTHYQTAGEVRLPSGYANAKDEAEFTRRFYTPSPDVMTSPVNMDLPQAQMMTAMPPAAPAPQSVLAQIAQPVAAEPVASYSNEHLRTPMEFAPQMAAPARQMTPAGAVPLGNERMANMQAMLAAYGPKDSAYSEDLRTARASAKAESDAFANMLKTAMSSPENEKSSKAEMYFRLASAFGSPTKTGQFSENLGMVGKELGEMAKSKRTDAQQKLALMLKGQEMKMAAAKEDLNTLRTLTGEEMKDKRTIATELIKDYIKSGEPQSAAGKQALDEGLKAGTPAYQKRVSQIGDANIEGKMGAINAQLAGISMAQANFALNQLKFENQQKQQAKLTGPEVKMKDETSQALVTMKDAYADLKKALELNENAYDGSLVDQAQYKLLSAGGSKDPKVVNTGVLDNLLKLGALSTAATTLKTQISDSDMKMLNQVQGSGAKSKEERAAILKAAQVRLKNLYTEKKAKLAEINSGAYRETTSTPGEIE